MPASNAKPVRTFEELMQGLGGPATAAVTPQAAPATKKRSFEELMAKIPSSGGVNIGGKINQDPGTSWLPMPEPIDREKIGRRVEAAKGGLMTGLGNMYEFVGDATDLVNPRVIKDMQEQRPGENPFTNIMFGPEDLGDKARKPLANAIKANFGETPEQADDPASHRLRTASKWVGEGAGMARAPLMLSGAFAALGEQVGGKTGEFVGGITGAFTPSFYGFIKNGFIKGGEIIKNFFTGGGAETTRSQSMQSAAYVTAHMDDEATAVANIAAAVDRGELGSLGQLSKDKGLLALEKAADSDQAVAHQLKRINDDINAEAVAQIEGVVPAGVDETLLRKTLAARVAQEQAETAQIAGRQTATAERETLVSQEANQATTDRVLSEVENTRNTAIDEIATTETQGKAAIAEDLTAKTVVADDAAAAVNTEALASGASKGLAAETDKVKKVLHTDMVEARKAVPVGAKISTKGIRSTVTRLKNELHELNTTEFDEVMEWFKPTLDKVFKLRDEVSLEELISLRSILGAKVQAVKEAGAARNAPAFIDKVRETLKNKIDSEGARAEYGDFTAKAVKYYDFINSEIGSALSQNADNFSAKSVLPGQKGNTTAEQFIDAAKLNPAIHGAVEADLMVKLRDLSAGNLTPESAKRFLTKYNDTLVKFPELQAKVRAAAETTGSLKTATKAAAAKEKALEATRKTAIEPVEAKASDAVGVATTRHTLNKDEIAETGKAVVSRVKETKAAALKEVKESPIARYAHWGEVKDQVDSVYSKSPHTVNESIKQIAAVAKADKTGESLASAQKAFMLKIMGDITSESGKIQEKALRQFKALRGPLEKNGVFSVEEMDRVQDALVEAQKMFFREGMRGRKLKLNKQGPEAVLAALLGAKLGAMVFGSPLIGASLGRRAVTKALVDKPNERMVSLAYEMLTDPDKFKAGREALEHSSDPKNVERVLLGWLKSVGDKTRPAVVNETQKDD